MNSNEKIVIFDWGGVIENHDDKDYGWYALTNNIINRLSKGSNKTIKRWSSFLLNGVTTSICTINNKKDLYKWIDYIAKKNNFDNDKKEFLKVYNEEYSKIMYYNDVVEYIHTLKSRCKLGILSNLIMLDKDRLNKQVDFNYFDYLFLSFELGMVKPNQDIYEKVENILNISPSNILFIDDREDNVKAASIRGWNVLQATGEDLELIRNKIEDFLE